LLAFGCWGAHSDFSPPHVLAVDVCQTEQQEDYL
jgi:hypothetical protein